MCNLAALAECGEDVAEQNTLQFRDYGKRNIYCSEIEIRKSGFASTSVYFLCV